MNQRKIVTNYLYNLSYQILQIMLPIITTPYISRVLGVDGVGTYSVTYAITNYYILFGMIGISTYGSRQIAYSRDDLCKKSQIFWDINTLKILTMGTSTVIFYLYVLIFVAGSEKLLFMVQGIVLLAQVFDISWYFTGVEGFKKTAVRNMLVKLSSVILIFILVKEKEDLVLYAFIISFSMLVGQLALWSGLRKEVSFVKPNMSSVVNHLKQTIPLWIPSIAINIYNSIDKVMLSNLVNNTSVGLYESSQKLVKVAATVTTSLSAVIAPNIANNFKNGRVEQTKRICTNSMIFISMISIPICFGMIGIRNTIVPWFYGKGYESVSELLLLSSWLVITLGWSSIFGTQILISCNEEKKYTKAIFVSLVINLLLNTLLIPRLAERGAIIASVIAEYTGMILMMIACRRWIYLRNVLAPLSKYVCSGIVMCLLIQKMESYVPFNVVGTCIQIFFGSIFYFVILLLLREKNTISVLKRTITKVAKKVCNWI